VVQADLAQSETPNEALALQAEVDRLRQLTVATATLDPGQCEQYKILLAEAVSKKEDHDRASETVQDRARRLRRQAKETYDKFSSKMLALQTKEDRAKQLQIEMQELEVEILELGRQGDALKKEADEASAEAGLPPAPQPATGPLKPPGMSPQTHVQEVQKYFESHGLGGSVHNALLQIQGAFAQIELQHQQDQERQMQQRAAAVAVSDAGEGDGSYERPVDIEYDEHMDLETPDWLTVGKGGRVQALAKRCSQAALQEAVKHAHTKSAKGKGKGKPNAVAEGLSEALRGLSVPVETITGPATPQQEPMATEEASSSAQASGLGCRV
jgi:hypothetical protein